MSSCESGRTGATGVGVGRGCCCCCLVRAGSVCVVVDLPVIEASLVLLVVVFCALARLDAKTSKVNAPKIESLFIFSSKTV